MHLLLIHQNFPGQFRELAPAWLRAGNQITGIGNPDTPPSGDQWANLRYLSYGFTDQSGHFNPSPSPLERGQAVGDLCRLLMQCNDPPDLVLAHSGWGEALMLRQSIGTTPLVVYPELWATAQALGVGFDSQMLLPEGGAPGAGSDLQHQLAIQNLITELAISQADAAVIPSRSQRHSFPLALQAKLELLPDGVDTERLRPNPSTSFDLAGVGFIHPGDLVVTLVSRQLEPLRGLRELLRAWPQINKEHPQARLVLVGGTDQGYGVEPPHGDSHIGDALSALSSDDGRERVHVLGRLPYEQLITLLQCSICHVGLSYPYTLSWSLTEAMSCGAPLITNHGSPLAPYIEPGKNGLLVPFNDTDALVQAVGYLLSNPSGARAIGLRGRETVEEQFSLWLALELYNALFHRLVARR